MTEKGFGFPREHRIVRSEGFASVRRKGRRIGSGSFIAYVAPGGEACSRLGVIASRKVGNSVRRNRAKRLAREVFRLNAPAIASPVDVVLIIRADATREPDFASYEQDLVQVLAVYRRASA